MRIISSGSRYMVFPDDINTHDQLPAGTYRVNFSQNSGFSLERVADLKVGDEKLYGPHKAKMNKVLQRFAESSRSMGIILSGHKGIGKTLSLRILAEDSDLPVILVDQGYPGIVEFIDSIEQETLVIFDEFDKHFPVSSNEVVSQENFLSLFDGLSAHKRLYAITANRTNHISEYLLNRPGRIHYHFKYSRLSDEEIRSYLEDNVPGISSETIIKVISVAAYARVNFDILRALSFELRMGSSLSEALEDLNFETDRGNRVKFQIHTREHGDVSFYTNTQELLSGRISSGNCDSSKGYYVYDVSLEFDLSSVRVAGGVYAIEPSQVSIHMEERDGQDINLAKDDVVSVSGQEVVSGSHTLADLV